MHAYAMDRIQQKANKCPQAENTNLQRQLNLIRFPNQSTFLSHQTYNPQTFRTSLRRISLGSIYLPLEGPRTDIDRLMDALALSHEILMQKGVYPVWLQDCP